MKLRAGADLEAFRISPADRNRLAVLAGPEDGADVSIVFEVWEPGGAQPPNSHPRSVEVFVFLAGEGVAVSDGRSSPVRAGDVLVLPPGSVHHITNTGAGRLYAITTMTPDDGFAALIRAGIRDVLDDADLAVLGALG